jgi:CRP/FNR family nitrogen fixation transcriptional regulator
MELNLGAPSSFSRNQEVFGEGELADYLYRVKSGCIRTYSTFRDGRRQVTSFYLPGEYFGLELEKLHSFSAEAVTPSLVYAIKRNALTKREAANNKITSRLLALTALELRRTQRHVLLLLKTARERVGQFILDLAERQNSLREVDMPMTRGDIADYLGLTAETVSRMLWGLENTSVISVQRRRVILRDVLALKRINA